MSYEEYEKCMKMVMMMKDDKRIKGSMRKSEKILYAVCIVLIIWFISSYINTICHNMSDYNYAWWNMFEIFCKIVE